MSSTHIDLRPVESHRSYQEQQLQAARHLLVQSDQQSQVLNTQNNSLNLTGDSVLKLQLKMSLPKLTEKSVIIHRDENGFGLRIKGQSPVYIEHVHEGGAAWRAGVRAFDSISKVNGIPVSQMDHKDVVLMFKSCSRFVALTLISYEQSLASNKLEDNLDSDNKNAQQHSEFISNLINASHHRQYSIYSHHPNEDCQSGDGNCTNYSNLSMADTTSLFASNDYAIEASPSALLMDRTRSCRSTINGSNYAIKLGRQAHINSANNQLAGQQASRLASNSMSMSMLVNDLRRDSIQQQKLNRRDSNDDKSDCTLGDKRIAMCTCCQQVEGCQNCCDKTTPIANNKLVRAHQIHCQQSSLTLDECPESANSSCNISRANNKPNVRNERRLEDTIEGVLSSNLTRANQSLQMKQFESLQSDSTNSLPNFDKKVANSSRVLMDNSNGNSRRDIKPSNQMVSRRIQNNQQHLLSVPCVRPRQINKRSEIIRELIDTERTHTERLRCLDELFYRPLKQAAFTTSEQLRMVFSCHRTLYKIHRQIYRTLLSAHYDIYSEPLVGSALIEIFEGDLKGRLERAACSFCSAQATNIELLNKLTRRDTKVGEFLAEVTNQRVIGRLGIKDLLASCFQRLTKYPLLLESLLKATPLLLNNDSDEETEDGANIYHQVTVNDRNDTKDSPCKLAIERQIDTESCLTASDEDELNDDGDGDDNHDDHDEGTSRSRCEFEEREELERKLKAAEEARKNSRRMLAVSLAEEREFIERALVQSRQILVRVNDSIRVAMSRNKLKEIWKRTDKYPGVPLIDISKQQVVHEGALTLRLSKRSFDVYVLLLNDYLIILTREGQDKYRLKFFTPEGKASSSTAVNTANSSTSQSSSSANNSAGFNSAGTISNLVGLQQNVYSPVFVIDEHLTTRDAATDENGFYLLCKRKDDSRIYEFASRSPAERIKWRDKIQWAIERQMSRNKRRPSCESTLTKSNSGLISNDLTRQHGSEQLKSSIPSDVTNKSVVSKSSAPTNNEQTEDGRQTSHSRSSSRAGCEPTKIVGTISYVIDDGIVMPNKMESSRVLVDQAIQVNILDGISVSTAARTNVATSNDLNNYHRSSKEPTLYSIDKKHIGKENQ